MPSTTLTIPVRCPKCLHQGPAFSYLLGRRSRCKMCNHSFLIPKHLRVVCPGCSVGLRVLPEAIGRNVACKFCNQEFRISPDLLSGGTVPCPGEHPAAKSIRDRAPATMVAPDLEERLRTTRDELVRMERERSEQAERLLAVEQALLRMLGDQAAFKGSIQRLQADNDALVQQKHSMPGPLGFSLAPSRQSPCPPGSRIASSPPRISRLPPHSLRFLSITCGAMDMAGCSRPGRPRDRLYRDEPTSNRTVSGRIYATPSIRSLTVN